MAVAHQLKRALFDVLAEDGVLEVACIPEKEVRHVQHDGWPEQ